LAEEKYEAELCKQMTKTLSEVCIFSSNWSTQLSNLLLQVVKARVKELMIPRYKIICIVHIGKQSILLPILCCYKI
jgi:hypothetical protein